MGPSLLRNNMLTSAAIGSNGRALSGVGDRVASQDAGTSVNGILG